MSQNEETNVTWTNKGYKNWLPEAPIIACEKQNDTLEIISPNNG